jgi:hypothetical protein
LTGLQTLDLARTHVTDAGLTHLAPLERLLQINLADTGTTHRAVPVSPHSYPSSPSSRRPHRLAKRAE